jgi:hypothetical protein
LIVFAKAPLPGAVKTRLARGIGTVAAWRFYRRTLAQLLQRVARDPRWDTVVALTPDRYAQKNLRIFKGLPHTPQGFGDLGRRMAEAFLRAGTRPAVLVGGDIPDLTRRHITEAFQALGRADAVFGPAEDGGFWLVGLRCPGRDARRLFRRVRWSGPYALADTLGNLGPPRRAELIETLRDVDTEDDYKATRARADCG